MSDTAVIDDASDTVIVTEDRVEVVSVGCRDRLGQPGVSGDANYTQAFTNASTVTVNHNLGKYPAVTVITSAGDEVEGDVDLDLWVPRTRSRYATCRYSCMRPPRSGRPTPS